MHSDAGPDSDLDSEPDEETRTPRSSWGQSGDALEDDFESDESNQEEGANETIEMEDNDREEGEEEYKDINADNNGTQRMEQLGAELPFTFGIPESEEAFNILLQERSSEEVQAYY